VLTFFQVLAHLLLNFTHSMHYSAHTIHLLLQLLNMSGLGVLNRYSVGMKLTGNFFIHPQADDLRYQVRELSRRMLVDALSSTVRQINLHMRSASEQIPECFTTCTSVSDPSWKSLLSIPHTSSCLPIGIGRVMVTDGDDIVKRGRTLRREDGVVDGGKGKANWGKKPAIVQV